MDYALIRSDPGAVRNFMASSLLAGPGLSPELGDIRLVPHQVDAASRLIALLLQRGSALLADATGMGKTFVAIAVARAVGQAVIVAPAALRSMWHDALRRARVPAPFESYEALARGTVRGLKAPALLILDEAHHARNPTSRRYAALADLSWGSRLLLLTATPIHNRLDDLRALFALSLGSQAWSMSADDLSAFTVRRAVPGRARAWAGSRIEAAPVLPALERPKWLDVEPDPGTFRAIEALPPAVPPADGGSAHALLTLGLLRAWSSSAAALRAMLRRRMQRAAALTASLQSGRYPTRAELSAWSVVDDSLQLGFADLLAVGSAPPDVARLDDAIAAHCAGVRGILESLDRSGPAQDASRIALLEQVQHAHRSSAVVAFTQFADTAVGVYRAVAHRGAVALVTGRGARIASGRVSTAEIVRRFDDVTDPNDGANPLMHLRLLVASDVLSEGLSLRRASVLVHLDLPWTLARLEQRVGRLRRIGSPHARIAVYAIGPPVSARELTSVVRALRRKARVAAALGAGEIPESEPILGIHLRRATRIVVERSDAHAAEALRGILTTWLDPGRRVAGSNGTLIAGASVGHLPTADSWAALALVRQASRLFLVRAAPGGVSDRPSEVLPLARMIEQRVGPLAVGHADSTPDDEVAANPGGTIAIDIAPFASEALTRLREWIASRRASQLVAPAIEAPSSAHSGVLRFLDGLVAGASRSELPSLLPRVERCRSDVLTARGIGAERAMDRWLGERRYGETPRSPGDAVDALAALLSSRSTAPRTDTRDGSIAAMLVLHVGHH